MLSSLGLTLLSESTLGHVCIYASFESILFTSPQPDLDEAVLLRLRYIECAGGGNHYGGLVLELIGLIGC